MKDDRNLDAWIQLAHLAPNMDTTLEILEAAKKIGSTSSHAQE